MYASQANFAPSLVPARSLKTPIKDGYVFYDLETSGTLRGYDQIFQIAAIRTNSDFDVIDREAPPFNLRCRRLCYQIPAPGALLVTNLDPEDLERPHLSHYDLVRAVHKKFTEWSPATFIGYNSIRFDEALLRQAFYQTLHPIYTTQIKGNRRADAYTMAQAMAIHAPDALHVDDSKEGAFRLGNLARANGIDLKADAAHDALPDTLATLGLMRLMQDRAPALFSRMMANADRKSVTCFVEMTPVFRWSAVFGRNRISECVTYVGSPPSDRNLLVMFNLAFDPIELFDLSDEMLEERIYGSVKAFRCARANAFPIILPLEFPPIGGNGGTAQESDLHRRAAAIADNGAFCQRVVQIVQRRCADRPKANFVEDRIFEKFISDHDAARCAKFHQTPWANRLDLIRDLDDERLRELGMRLIFVECPDLLPEDIRSQMTDWQMARIEADGEVPWLSAPAAIAELRKMWLSSDPLVRRKLEKIAAYIGSIRSVSTQKPHVIAG